MPEGADNLTRTAMRGLARFLLFLWVLIFVPAGTLYFWQGWTYWLVFAASTTLITLYFLKHDRGLIERRLHAGPGAEREGAQKIIQAFASVLVILLILTPAFDRRFGWSFASTFVAIIGNILVAAGFLITFIVFKENTHAAAIIAVDRGQQLVSTGLYRWVRHPMYAGAIVMFFATPLALGSYWGLVWAGPLVGAIVWRLIEEEKFLSSQLPGYDEYRQVTRYRLVPLIW